LKLDLLSTQCRGGGQCSDLIKRAAKLLCGFNKCRAFQRPLSRFPPKSHGFFNQASLCAVTRHKLGLVLGNLGKLGFEDFGDASMKRAPRLPQ
jgi:hypothetical protein